MVRSPAAKPPGAPRIDFAVLHAASAGVSLAAAAGIGIALLILPASAASLHLAAAYGVFGLVGFLAQMVAGMEARLLPLVTWYWTYERSGFRVPPPSPFTMRDRALQAMVFAGWTIGVPSLAAGMFLEAPRVVAAGAWSLSAAVAIAAVDNVMVLTHMRRQHPQPDEAERDEIREEQRRHRRGAAQDPFEQRRAWLPHIGRGVQGESHCSNQTLHEQDDGA
jgi:hypothetical protein